VEVWRYGGVRIVPRPEVTMQWVGLTGTCLGRMIGFAVEAKASAKRKSSILKTAIHPMKKVF
jgi:hypothetical protein